MLYPVYKLLFDKDYLALTEDQIAISYKTYKSDNENDMQAIIDQKLTPGIMARKSKLCVKQAAKIELSIV